MTPRAEHESPHYWLGWLAASIHGHLGGRNPPTGCVTTSQSSYDRPSRLPNYGRSCDADNRNTLSEITRERRRGPGAVFVREEQRRTPQRKSWRRVVLVYGLAQNALSINLP